MNTEPVIDALSSVRGFDLEIERFRFDEVPEDKFFDEDLIQESFKRKPDAVFYIGSLEGPYLPRPHIFKEIQKTCPIVNFIFDGACPNGWPALKKFREEKCFTSSVNIDGNQDWPKGENDITILCPIDPRPYEKTLEKVIRVGFCGGASSLDRSALFSELQECGLITIPMRDESLGSYSYYADFMLRCKSVVNMAKTGSGQSMHVKARVVEAGLAKCCLFEQEGSPTKNWFKPGVDFLEYKNVSHLKELIKEMRDKPKAMQSLGESLHRKVMADHSPKISFGRIFEKIGLECHK